MSESLSQFKALIFDVYGTLVVSSVFFGPLPEFLNVDHDRTGKLVFSRQSRLFTQGQEWSKSDALLAFSAVESDLQTKSPAALYSDILATAYDELSRRRASTRRGRLDATQSPIARSSRALALQRTIQRRTRTPTSSPAISSDQTQHSPAAAMFATSLAAMADLPRHARGARTPLRARA
jgi:hypothetical protein